MRARAALVVSGALLLAACGSAGTPDASRASHLLSVLAATESAESFRYQTVRREVSDDATDHTSDRTTDGAIDFEHDVSVQRRPSTSSDPTPFEFRVLGNIGYQRIGGESASFYAAPEGTKWIRTDADRIAEFGGCIPYYLASSSSVLGNAVTTGLPRPDDVLDSLRGVGAELVRLGSDTVRGASTTHWRIDVSGVTTTTVPATCLPNLDGVHQGPRRVEIWTDADSRLRRVEYTSTMTFSNPVLGSGSGLPGSVEFEGPSSITTTTTTEFFDFGASVEVSAPPADEVFDATEQVGAMFAGPGTVADSEWHSAADGTFRGGDWSVWYARTDTKWRCYDVVGLERSADFEPPIALPKHDGRMASCLPGAGYGNGPFTAIIAGVDADRWVLVGRVDESVLDAKLELADGGSITLPIDPESRIVRWVGPRTPAPLKLESGGTTCTLSDDVPTTGDEETCDGVGGSATLLPPTASAPC